MRTISKRLTDILKAIAAIRLYRDSDELPPRVREVWLIYHIMIIGEAASGLPDEARQAMPTIPWRQIVGMRNELAHAYFKITMQIVERVAAERIEELADAIQQYQEQEQGKDAPS